MNQIKKIAILVHSLEKGGMEKVAAQLSEMFTEVGYEVFVFVSEYDKHKAYSHKGKVIECPFYFSFGKLSFELGSYAYNSFILRKEKEKYGIDVTVSVAPEMNLINILAGTKDKKILTIHSCTSLRKDVISIAYRPFFFKLYRLAYRTVSVSEWVANDLIKNYSCSRKKTIVINNPVQMSQGDTEERKTEPIVLSVGRLEDIKRQWHVIRSFKEVLDKFPSACLWIVGDGPNRQKLEKMAYEMGISERVRFWGQVSDMEYVYRKGKVLVITSGSEAFPCVAIEALSHGLPIVSANVPGGLKEIMGVKDNNSNYPIYTDYGVVVDTLSENENTYSPVISKEEKEMGNIICDLLSNEDEYDRLSHNCRIHSREYDYCKIKEQWIQII